MRLSKKQIPIILQKSKYDCGLACLAMIMSHTEGIRVNINKLKGDKGLIGREGTDLKYLRDLSEEYGYALKGYKINDVTEASDLEFPLMIHWTNNHFVILEGVKGGTATIIDPAAGRIALDIKTFQESFSGVVIDLKKSKFEQQDEQKIKQLKEIGLTKKIGKYMLQERKLLYTIIFFSFIFQGISLLTPFLTQYIVDSFMTGNGKAIPYTSLLLMVVASIFILYALSILRMKLIITLQVRLNKSLTNQFVRKLFSLPIKFFEINSSGDIATRINNISVIREIISRLASTFILDISLLVVFCIVMLYYSPLLSSIVFIGALVQIVVTKWLIPKIEMYTKQEVNSQSLFQSQMVEMLRSITFIKTVGDTKTIENQLNELFDRQIGHFSNRMNVSSILGGVSNSINMSLPLLILLIGVGIGVDSGLTLGAIVAFSTIAGRFMMPLGSIIGSLESVKFVEEMVDRVESVLEEEEEQMNDERGYDFDPKKEAIKLENITFSYESQNDILNGINLTINPNEKISLVGKTGSGKSTLFKILSGLYQPTDGHIYYGANKLSDMNMKQLRQNIGIIVQDVSLFNDTVLNNIKYFNGAITREDAIQAAKDACIHEEIIKLPMGYDTIIGENGISLSGGQRQRIAIARVLAKNPQILLIDEGTSNLDKATEREILSKIYAREITVISITHRTDSINENESVYELQNGKLVPLKKKSMASTA
ncbi:peptidase domain-containing ABC transporter [Paenibacillus sp. L3-i20]|uniref:peptidase domain-containing ABC transporter n=1 Tax=Paenibacillus sp. L3-i20 TaxID=2905833 RepID=UPI001EDCDB13|nr:peptidase domain-containing ABC transporter [Paenibacillus sp. L3-i20]GKU76406.1 ABC transporter [Paenibacillus sp. L3-i20]